MPAYKSFRWILSSATSQNIIDVAVLVVTCILFCISRQIPQHDSGCICRQTLCVFAFTLSFDDPTAAPALCSNACCSADTKHAEGSVCWSCRCCNFPNSVDLRTKLQVPSLHVTYMLNIHICRVPIQSHRWSHHAYSVGTEAPEFFLCGSGCVSRYLELHLHTFAVACLRTSLLNGFVLFLPVLCSMCIRTLKMEGKLACSRLHCCWERLIDVGGGQ